MKMKQLKFEHTFAKAIKAGNKTATFRINDDKDIRLNDVLQLVDKVDANHPTTWTIPGEIHINDVAMVPFEKLSKEQISSAESFASTQEMLQTFRRFYGEHISGETPVLVIGFTYEPYEQPLAYLQTSNSTNTYLAVAKLFADGGSRGNPGPSAAGFVVVDESNTTVHIDNKYLGLTTNNQAEYHALIMGLEWCIKQHIPVVHVYLDSMLVVNQLKGIFKVKNRELWTLYETAKALSESFEKFSITHVPRELNKLADAEVNKALDAVKGSDVVQ
jgi:ribonuclease HI